MAQGGGRSIRGRPVNTESAEASDGPRCNNGRHRTGWAEPDVVFRIVHVALEDGSSPTDGPSPSSYRDQAVEIALGPNPTFDNGRVAALTRRVPQAQVVTAVRPSRRKTRRHRPRERAGPPRIVETLRKAIEWQRQLDAGEVSNQADIAHREGISRARVTQVMGLLRLSPSIQEYVSRTPDIDSPAEISERALRLITRLTNHERQHEAISALLKAEVVISSP